MNRKILAILAILAVGIAAVSFVSAADPVTVNGSTVTVNGMEFNVLDGYKYNETASNLAVEAFNGEPNTVAYLDNGTDYVIIGVLNNTAGISLDKLNTGNYPEKTINGKSGFLQSEDEYALFEYIDADKVVMIQSSDEKTINSSIK